MAPLVHPGVEGQTVLSAPPPVAIEPPVLNPEVRRLMTMVDSTPRGMEFRMGVWGKSWPQLFDLAKKAREYFFPQQKYESCVVMRGKPHQRPAFLMDQPRPDTPVLMWKKGPSHTALWICQLQHWMRYPEKEHISAVVYFKVIAQRPSLIQQLDGPGIRLHDSGLLYRPAGSSATGEASSTAPTSDSPEPNPERAPTSPNLILVPPLTPAEEEALAPVEPPLHELWDEPMGAQPLPGPQGTMELEQGDRRRPREPRSSEEPPGTRTRTEPFELEAELEGHLRLLQGALGDGRTGTATTGPGAGPGEPKACLAARGPLPTPD